MHTKRTTFPTEMKIATHFEELAEIMHRNWHLFVIRVFFDQKNQYADLYRTT